MRLASRSERVGLVGLGVALGAAMLATVLGGSLTAQERSVARARGLAPAERGVRAGLGAIEEADDELTLAPLQRGDAVPEPAG